MREMLKSALCNPTAGTTPLSTEETELQQHILGTRGPSVKHFRRRDRKLLSLLPEHPRSHLLCWSHSFLEVSKEWKSLGRRGKGIASEGFKHGFIGWKEKLLPPTRGFSLNVFFRFRLDIRKKFFTMRVVRPWPRLPREAVTAPSLAVLKARLDGALSNLGWWEMSLLVAGGLEPDDL